MKVRERNVADSDKRSAKLFFEALRRFYDMKNWRVLDAFARNGQLTIPNYMDQVNGPGMYVEAWELGEEHRQDLQNLGIDVVHIGDSYARAHGFTEKFDMVVIDTPQGLHHDDQLKVHAEHFDFMRLALENLIADQGLLVLYVNRQPYDKDEIGSQGYDEYEEYDFKAWMEARSKFYRCHKPTDLQMNEAMYGYQRLLSVCGFKLVNTVIVPCFSDVENKPSYAFRLGLEVKRL